MHFYVIFNYVTFNPGMVHDSWFEIVLGRENTQNGVLINF